MDFVVYMSLYVTTCRQNLGPSIRVITLRFCFCLFFSRVHVQIGAGDVSSVCLDMVVGARGVMLPSGGAPAHMHGAAGISCRASAPVE